MGFTWPWYKDVQKVRTEMETQMGEVDDRLQAAEGRITASNAQITKGVDEIKALVQQLRDEVAANAVQDSTLNALDAAVDSLGTGAQTVDDVVPDEPAPTPPPEPNP